MHSTASTHQDGEELTFADLRSEFAATLREKAKNFHALVAGAIAINTIEGHKQDPYLESGTLASLDPNIRMFAGKLSLDSTIFTLMLAQRQLVTGPDDHENIDRYHELVGLPRPADSKRLQSSDLQSLSSDPEWLSERDPVLAAKLFDGDRLQSVIQQLQSLERQPSFSFTWGKLRQFVSQEVVDPDLIKFTPSPVQALELKKKMQSLSVVIADAVAGYYLASGKKESLDSESRAVLARPILTSEYLSAVLMVDRVGLNPADPTKIEIFRGFHRMFGFVVPASVEPVPLDVTTLLADLKEGYPDWHQRLSANISNTKQVVSQLRRASDPSKPFTYNNLLQNLNGILRLRRSWDLDKISTGEAAKYPVLEGGELAKTVKERLSVVPDPDVTVSVVAMGLVPLIRVTGTHVHIQFRPTTSRCGMKEQIRGDLEKAARSTPGINSATVEIVTAPWNAEMIAPDGVEFLKLV